MPLEALPVAIAGGPPPPPSCVLQKAEVTHGGGERLRRGQDGTGQLQASRGNEDWVQMKIQYLICTTFASWPAVVQQGGGTGHSQGRRMHQASWRGRRRAKGAFGGRRHLPLAAFIATQGSVPIFQNVSVSVYVEVASLFSKYRDGQCGFIPASRGGEEYRWRSSKNRERIEPGNRTGPVHEAG